MKPLRIAQAVIGLGIVAAAIAAAQRQWDAVATQPISWQIDWRWIAASLLLTWVMYGLLMAGWRHLVVTAGERLGAASAARIWLLSSLGKYIPGKIWTIAGMAVLAEQAGVRSSVATTAAVTMQLLAIITGMLVAVTTLGFGAIGIFAPGGWTVAALVGASAVVAVALLASPTFCTALGRLAGRPELIRPVAPAAAVMAAIPNIVSWLGYGLALLWLARGTIGDSGLEWTAATGAFALSYLAGYLFLLAPGGIGVREGVLVLVLQNVIGTGPSLALAAVSRLALTINELGVALPLLVLSRNVREPG